MIRCRLAVLTLMISVLLCGCSGAGRFSDDEQGIYEKIHRKYIKMESYSAKVRLTVKGNKTENVYELEQMAKGGDKTLSKLTAPEYLNGLETVRNGEKVRVRYGKDEKHELEVIASEDIDLSFVSNFFSNYYKSEETAVSVNSDKVNSGTTLLETELPMTSARRQKATMLIDNRTIKPLNITVYDMGGNIVFIAEFIEFEYNAPLDDENFEI